MAVPVGVYLYIQNKWVIKPLPLGSKIPSVTLSSVNGDSAETDALITKKTVLIFFTTSCEHCKAEIAAMNSLYPEFKDAIDFFGISLNTRNETVEFVIEHHMAFPVFFDTTGVAKRQFRIVVVPASYYISRQKKLLKYRAGEQHKDSLRKTLATFATLSNDSLSVL
ncbi:MAG TPA: TlpA disulfide reductase family protein [Candidatus Nitrosotenuis sp.]|nr:TlpA disulfide reductase family protein [Candidatus Nitrosotenuis sp.]